MTKPLPTVPVHAIDPQPDAPQWLVRDLWTTAAVGVIGGSPKVNIRSTRWEEDSEERKVGGGSRA